jgi:hypothetical protein
MAGTVVLFPGVDLAAPSGEQWNAEKGLLVNERSADGELPDGLSGEKKE